MRWCKHRSNQKGKRSSRAYAYPQNTVNTLTTQKLKQELATMKKDPSNKGCLQKKSPTTNTTKTPTSSPNQHESPPFIASIRKTFRHQIRVQSNPRPPIQTTPLEHHVPPRNFTSTDSPPCITTTTTLPPYHHASSPPLPHHHRTIVTTVK